ncbi:cation diffusion facilitator family transporter [Microbacterium sp. SORGH_AS 1204]|uniref:cation diffusion facilitator family transporter n=1 Tax=Microbacterium sp. SORGH_AS_1204 TaxID=3041785 RepID=UPI002792DCDB|nr:cation diffusion facilitator family transporter [Microbacterium sp. SORGH_AS_1204]MDQ1138167.1 cation diffusion facilitator family transporter [Microbacterium sp. SORGH_AS_1204]
MSGEVVRFGRTELPPKQVEALRRAVRLEWVTIGVLVITATLVFIVLGSSQAMKAAWSEDLLSFIPPIAFLIAVRLARRPPTTQHPYGFHRSVAVGHLVAAVALTGMGTFLLVDSAINLLRGEHPTIGTVNLFGVTIWLGWLMIAVMAVTGIPPVILGRIKIGLARELHNKVLYADADMNKADWQTSLGTIIGVLGIGVGLWWMDAAAAIFISGSILHDGVSNLRAAVVDLMDARATTFDDNHPHPLAGRVDQYLAGLPWVARAGSRVRDEGHVFHIEAFVVPRRRKVALADIERARQGCVGLDWKVQDVVIVPVPRLPDVVDAVTPPGSDA